MSAPVIAICHGQNCRDVGGKALADKLEELNMPHQIIPCQSLCSYAPTAKRDGIAILRATVEDILKS